MPTSCLILFSLLFYGFISWLRFAPANLTRTVFLRLTFNPVTLLLFGVLSALVGGEIILQIHDFGYVLPSAFIRNGGCPSRKPHSEVIYQGIPVRRREYTVHLEYNGAGWHDWDYPLSPAPKVTRIAFLGDFWVRGQTG